MAHLKFQPLDKTDFIMIVLGVGADSISPIASILVYFAMTLRAIRRAEKIP